MRQNVDICAVFRAIWRISEKSSQFRNFLLHFRFYRGMVGLVSPVRAGRFVLPGRYRRKKIRILS